MAAPPLPDFVLNAPGWNAGARPHPPMIACQKTSRRLGNVLVERGFLSLEQLQAALQHQHEVGQGKLLGEILVEQEYCSEDQVIEALAVDYDVPYAKLEQRLQDGKVIGLAYAFEQATHARRAPRL